MSSPGSAATATCEDVEKPIQLPSRFAQGLNVPQGYASAFRSLRPCWLTFLNILFGRDYDLRRHRPTTRASRASRASIAVVTCHDDTMLEIGQPGRRHIADMANRFVGQGIVDQI